MRMEERDYAGRGTTGLAATGTALGGAALAGVLSQGGGLLGGLFGGGCHENMPINRYELKMQQEIAAKDSKIALLESNIYVDSKISDVYERLNNKIGCIEAQLCEQRVYNATNTSALSCLQGQVAQLASLTKLVIPITSVCPEPAVATTT